MWEVPSGGSPDKTTRKEETVLFACLPSLLLASASTLLLALLHPSLLLGPSFGLPMWTRDQPSRNHQGLQHWPSALDWVC